MPSPVILTQVTSTPDVLQVDNFSLFIPNPPGGGDGAQLNIRNLSAALPGLSTAVIQTRLHRHVKHSSGRQEFGSYQIPARFVEMNDRSVIQALLAWHQAKVDQATGLTNSEAAYKTIGYVQVYNSAQQPSEQRTLYGLFLESLAQVSLGGDPKQLEWDAVLRYDNWQPGGL